MTKQYHVYKVKLTPSGNLLGSSYINFKSKSQAINCAKQMLCDNDIIEMLVYDTFLEVPIISPVFRQVKDDLIIANNLQDKYCKFWEEKLEV